MDGRLITEMRTAALSSAATKYLASSESRVLALLGSGVQAKAHLDALSRVRHFEVRVWSGDSPSMPTSRPISGAGTNRTRTSI
jgi:ornithine cyclodeaminase/alanine dehydrogenase-like protein (mu-crystallin family)